MSTNFLLETNSKGPLIWLPECQYPHFIKSDSTSTQWSPPLSPCSPVPVVPHVSQVLNPQVAPGIIAAQQIKTPRIDSCCNLNCFPGNSSPPILPLNSTVEGASSGFMSVDETAEWIWRISYASGWDEADEYAWSFKRNDIWGYLLHQLTLDSLKYDLGISKFGHRLKIMLAIKHLHLSILGSDFSADSDYDKSPRADSLPLDTQISTSTQDMQGKTPSTSSQCMSSPAHHSPLQDVDFGEKEAIELPPKCSSINVMSSKTSKKSTRASPENPIMYKTFQKVKIRSGKSFLSANIGYLNKGSVVLINQVKGRSGRVVIQQDDGEIVKVGWVSLYTKDRQLLRQYNRRRSRT